MAQNNLSAGDREAANRDGALLSDPAADQPAAQSRRCESETADEAENLHGLVGTPAKAPLARRSGQEQRQKSG